jgi:uncharacterized membrane protein
MRNLQAYLIGALFVVAGSLHFVIPRTYEQIVPPYLPAHRELVAISGVFEILGGLGVLDARTRPFAGWGLIALLLAVFPANVFMATDRTKFAAVLPSWALYARLPLQFILIVWVYNACIATGRKD